MRTRRSTHRSIPRQVAILLATAALAAPALLAACSSEKSSGGDVATTTTITVPESSTSSSSTTSTTSTSTTTTEPFVLDGAIVMVANCSSKNGAAALLSTDLAAFGFTMGPATNGFGPDSKLATSKIYAKPGSEEVADTLSRLLDDIPVLRMPTPAWVTGGTEAIGATSILVMLGNDLAGKHLGEIATN